LYDDRSSSDEQLSVSHSFVVNKKYELGRRLEVKIHILAYGRRQMNHFTQTKFGAIKEHGHTTIIICVHLTLGRAVSATQFY
jgi:hypothetical protein